MKPIKFSPDPKKPKTEKKQPKPLKRSPLPKSKKPIKKVSDKRKIQNLQYSADRIVFLNKPENRKCPITGQPTPDVHHKFSGKDRSKYFLDQSTWLAVSREGHIWIHEHSKEARELGRSIVPMTYSSGGYTYNEI